MVFNFHAGKLEVQSRAGTSGEAARILNAGWIGTAISSSGESQIADHDMKEVYLSSVDLEGRVWASVVVGELPGFVEVSQPPSDQDALEVTINSGSRGYLTYQGDPLDQNIRRPDAPVGLLIMGYKNRRRYRIDGRIVSTTSSSSASGGDGDGGRGCTADSAINVDCQDPGLLSSMKFVITMAMGNCPKYLHVRDLVREEQATPAPPVQRSTVLSKEQQDWIASSATFMLGTYAGGQDGGADASNRGGNPGFIKALDERTIVFPDYRGNNLYLSLGNIAANAKAGLLFINRETGDVLQVSGEAHIMWEDDEGVSGINAGATTGKHIRIDVLAVIEAKGANPLRMKMKELSPFNPPLPVPPKLVPGDGVGGGAELQQRQQEDNHLMRCSEVLDAATGVKSFRFQPSTALGGVDDTEKLLGWTPGQYATFFFPSCEGVGCGTAHSGLYTLPVPLSPDGSRQAGAGNEPVVRTWTITSVHGDGSPLEITVQAKEGGVSEHMHSHLKLGDLVRVAVGGDFTFTDRMGVPPGRDSKILLLSAGIGVTPMIGALRWLKQREAKRCSDPDRCVVPAHPDVVAIHATRSKDAVPYLSEIVHQATKMTTNTEDTSTSTRDDATRVRFVLAVTQTAPKETLSGNKRSISAPEEQAGGGAASDLAGFSIVQGRPDESMLKREVPDVAERQVMLCGPDAFMVGMDGLLRGLGVASSRIHSEEFYF